MISMESRMLGDGHVRFGGRPRETDLEQSRHRARGRPNRADIRPIGDPVEVARLWKARVVVIREGDIALPSPMPDHLMVRTWVSPATSAFRPSGAVVLECARACLAGQQQR
jgi:hypothetical protein